MIEKYHNETPVVHESAYVAPNAMSAGAVTVGAGARIMFGAQIIAEGGGIFIGQVGFAGRFDFDTVVRFRDCGCLIHEKRFDHP